MTQKFKFTEGERVLCFHGPLIYEAKALKSTISKDKQIKYYIHYAGWNKNWDEWVPEDRVLKYNEINVQRQQEVFKEHSTTSKNKKASMKVKKWEGPLIKDGGGSSGGNESRPSTPPKEITALSTMSRSRFKQTPSTSTSSTIGSNSALTNKESDLRKDNAKDISLGIPKEEKEDSQKKKRGNIAYSNEKVIDKTCEKLNGNNPNSFQSPPSTSNATPLNTSQNEHRLEDIHVSNLSMFESAGSFLTKQEVKIKIPDELKQCLADDWDAITRQHKLIEVPSRTTVQDIVDQYIAYKKTSKSTNSIKEVKISDVMNGVVEYFNVMLGSQLLYKYERPRYAEVLQQYPGTLPSKLYGAFHLLRLFIKLGSMLAYSGMDQAKLTVLVTYLQDFLKFLVKNSLTYFTTTSFVNVTPEYHRNTQ